MKVTYIFAVLLISVVLGSYNSRNKFERLDSLKPLAHEKLSKMKSEREFPRFNSRHRPDSFETRKPKLCDDNLIVKWSRVYLRILKNTFGFLSPPMTSRALYMITGAMYDAMTPFTSNLKPGVCSIKERFPSELQTENNIVIAVSNAAITVIESIFRNHKQHLEEAYEYFNEIQSSIPSDSSAANIGVKCGQEMIESRRRDKSNEFGDEPGSKDSTPYGDFTNYYPVNPNQTVPGKTNCLKVRSRNHWTPLLVPSKTGPPKAQIVLSPQMHLVTSFAASTDLLRTLNPPPQLGTNTENAYHDEIDEILGIYQNLDDRAKVIAEYWADGPDSVLPPGHWHFIAMFMIKKNCLSIQESVKLYFLQSAAALDSGILCWAAKRFYDFIRPITAIQCSKFENQTISSYIGPYQGIGRILGKDFQPYQNQFFVSPAFQEFCSGHSAFSTASAEVLKRFFNSDEYGEDVIISEGKSLFEPRIERGEPGYIQGLTDRPNRGPYSRGYTPASDIRLTWKTFTEASDESGFSRRYGGIHFRSGDLECRKLGRRVGEVVFQKYQELTN
jgi:hypothetical protein